MGVRDNIESYLHLLTTTVRVVS